MLCTQKVSLAEISEEIADMLRVCFEGTVCSDESALTLTLPNGQTFRIACSECNG